MRSHAKAASAPSTHRENRTFSLGVLAVMLVCAAAFLGIGAPAASAAPEAQVGWIFQKAFGSGENTAFEFAHSSIAVDSHGNVFVANQGAGIARGYSSDGTSLGPYPFTGLVRNFAVDPIDDTMYVDSIFGEPSVARFTSDGKTTPTYTLDAGFSVPVGAGLAVDPTTQDLLVSDPGAEAVRRYDSTGTLLDTISTPSIKPTWIVAAPDGSFYVAPDGGSDITHFSGAGTVLGTIAGVGPLQGLAFDPVDELLVAAVGDKLKTYSSADALVSEANGKNGTGLGAGGSGRLYELANGALNEYAYGATPGVEAPVVSDIQPHSAHLAAEVDPGAGPPAGSVARFEYSVDGGENWNATPDQGIERTPTEGPAAIEADLTGILVNSEFLVRVKALNSLTSATSDAVSFSTPATAPEVITGEPSDITETSAVVRGTINAAGLQTTFYFEYGPTTSYGLRIPVGQAGFAGAGLVSRFFDRKIKNLQPGTTYHYRLVAENSLGTTEGADMTFTTITLGGAPHRVFEQVTPADKKGIPIDPLVGFYTNRKGSAVSYAARGGVEGSPTLSRYVSRRGAIDWAGGIGTDPPTTVTNFSIFFISTIGVSEDLTQAFVASNRKLTSDSVPDGGLNLYLRDIDTGNLTLIGGSTDPEAFRWFTASSQANDFIAGASDFSWIVFSSRSPLLPGAPGEAEYRWSIEGGLELVSVLPDGTPSSMATFEATTGRMRLVSDDGSRIYFTALGPESGVFLREDGETKPISVSRIPDDPSTPQAARVVGVSRDGRYAFLGSFGARLTEDAPGEYGDLYRYDHSDGSLEYTGTQLQGNDPKLALWTSDDGSTFYFVGSGADPIKVWRNGVLQAVPASVYTQSSWAFGSPDGQYLAFRTNITVGGGTNGIEDAGDVYLFDAESGQTSCASCAPDGSAGGGFLPFPEVDINNQLPNVVTDQGQVFFSTRKRLVAADTNGSRDVYEFQDGKAALISPGNGNYDALILGISEDGSNVFFATGQGLVGRDADETIDIYDARIGGGLSAQNPTPSQACSGEDCKPSSGSAPSGASVGSEALHGPGNVKSKPHRKCGKGKRAKKVKGKVRCVKKHKSNKAGKGGNR